MENKFLWPFLLLIVTLFVASLLLQTTHAQELITVAVNSP